MSMSMSMSVSVSISCGTLPGVVYCVQKYTRTIIQLVAHRGGKSGSRKKRDKGRAPRNTGARTKLRFARVEQESGICFFTYLTLLTYFHWFVVVWNMWNMWKYSEISYFTKNSGITQFSLLFQWRIHLAMKSENSQPFKGGQALQKIFPYFFFSC